MSEWMKLRLDFHRDPKLLKIGRSLESHSGFLSQHGIACNSCSFRHGDITPVTQRDVTGCHGSVTVDKSVTHGVTKLAVKLGSLAVIQIWAVANEHTKDGVFHDAGVNDLDVIGDCPGIGEAMIKAGWAKHDEASNTLTLIDFHKHNQTRKTRSDFKGDEHKREVDRKRQRAYREREKKKKEAVAQGVEDPVGASRKTLRGCHGDKSPKSKRESKNNSLFKSLSAEEERERPLSQTELDAMSPPTTDEIQADPWEVLRRKTGQTKADLVAYAATLNGGAERFTPESLVDGWMRAAAARDLQTYQGKSLSAMSVKPELDTWVHKVGIRNPEGNQLVQKRQGKRRQQEIAEPSEWRDVWQYHHANMPMPKSWAEMEFRDRQMILDDIKLDKEFSHTRG